MRPPPSRRRFLEIAGLATAASMIGASRPQPLRAEPTGEHRGRIFKSIKFGMFQERISILEKFKLMKDMGYDGAELNSPGGENKEEALAASRETGLPIHGVVDSIHWNVRLSDPDPAVREKARQGLETALRETRFVGGSAVLLVPGSVTNPERENHDQVWSRSIEEIRKVLPLAAKLGVHILIENVWNRFLYDHDGPDDQTAEKLATYIDEINSPWVGVYFDIGNHQKYGRPAAWIRTLGKRIVKLDVKDWGRSNGFSKIGEGDVDWAEVRAALREIGFTGWATAEVQGGDRERIRDIAQRMDQALGL